MKIRFYIPLFVLLVTSCSSNHDGLNIDLSHDQTEETESGTPLTPAISDVEYGTVTKKCHGSEGDSSISVLSYAYFTEEDSSYKQKVNQLIGHFTMDATLMGLSDPVDQPKLNKEFFDGLLERFIVSCDEDMGGGLWDLDAEISIQNDFEHFCQLSMSAWSYTGGAHGNGYVTYNLVDKSTGRELDYNDFFSDLDLLKVKLESNFRDQYDLAPDDDFAEQGIEFEGNKFQLADNFYFNEGKLFVYYNVYEIGPYVAGDYEVSIALDDIDDLLKIDPL